MKSNEIRQSFLDYFHNKGHEIVPSSPLVPENDPSLLFTNAGMVQFKDVFLGNDQRSYTRAASSQRCVRAGGKHNDLENVGYTARHHTFFEMLGNFSFGDYFKREAIAFAWEYLTKVLNIPAEKLWVTVFEEDDEAAGIWLKEIKIEPHRFSRCGEKDNFWSMGETGPCGPCSEIFYDHGPTVAGGPPGSPEEGGDRYVEIWNLVFMQYNRNVSGKIMPLPKPSVDTGMGLERIAAVLQGVHNNFDTDLFQHLIRATADLAGISDLRNTSLRVIADHIRSAAFLIVDGVLPSNEGRGYVLRRIIRRALRHGNKLDFKEPFFYRLVPVLIAEMGAAYPELTQAKSLVEKSLLHEEALFETTLEQGLAILENEILSLTSTIIPGHIVFKLYDTYGFPLDLTADIARERGLSIDQEGFHQEMARQRERSLAASRFSDEYKVQHRFTEASEFVGYEKLQEDTEIHALLRHGDRVSLLNQGEEGIVVLKHTPFYAESGGQIGDRGVLIADNAEFVVHDTQKQNDVILHVGEVIKGNFACNQNVVARVDCHRRQSAALNHSATHLLNAALRHLLGEHVIQRGSLVEPERLRFDFSHFEPLTEKQLYAIEDWVNEKIRANLEVTTHIMTPEEAMDSGAIGLFGEKYGKEVRVLCMGNSSMELCGGTHVRRTGDIGLFKIISEAGIAAGIRRIEAITGHSAFNHLRQDQHNLKEIAALLKADRTDIIDKLKQLLAQDRHRAREVKQLKTKLATGQGGDLSTEAKAIAGINVLARHLSHIHMDAKSLRELADNLKQKLGKAVVVLATVDHNKISLVVGVTKDITHVVHAGELVKYIAEQIAGKGGGRPDMAQGGGTKVDALATALESTYAWVENAVSIGK